MDCFSEIIGYHANYYTKCDSFLEGKFELSEDTQWLGTGMYFWDNLSNAKFWKKQKIRKNPCHYAEEYKIVIAKISCKDSFDFTNQEERDSFCFLWNIAKQKLSTEKILTMGFGQILDYVFFSFNFFDCSVVKSHADYSRNEENFDLFGKSDLSSTIKTIYSVRKDSAISCRKELF